MTYNQAYDHIFQCEVKIGNNKIQDLLNATKNPAVEDWNIQMRCKRWQWVPFPPINFWKCDHFLYCSWCSAHDEVCQEWQSVVRTVDFMEIDEFDNKIFPMKLTMHKWRFCHEVYGWDALAIHERIWYPNAKKYEDPSQGKITNISYYHSFNINSQEYLDLCKIIVDDVHEKLANRLERYKVELNKNEENKKRSERINKKI